MIMSRRAKRMERQHKRSEHMVSINLVSMIDIFTVLVFFLLVNTLVFSRITILGLNLPAATEQEQQAKERFDLEIIVRDTGIEVSDRNGGLIRRIAAKASGQDLAQLSELLQQIKARLPDKQDATLLLEPQIDYDTVVHVMDNIRVARVCRPAPCGRRNCFRRLPSAMRQRTP